ncbi:MAG: hypothetical protein K0S47_1477 [Herbinix sp.]|jgi:Cof subfamily protein (haloacid dehalogenase superfamily)|nr:hypothetical protein [Herbinix sp.]
MKTLYISDLDGTLLQPNIELSDYTIRTLNELIAGGLLFSVATARTIASVGSILKDVALTMPIILMNGVCIYDLIHQRYLKVEYLPQEVRYNLLTLIKDNQLKGFAYAIKDGKLSTYYEDLSSKPMKDFYEERVNKYKKPFMQVKDFTELKEEPIIYFSLMDQKEKLDSIYTTLSSYPELGITFYKDNYTPDIWYLEVFSKHASKYHAVQYLRSYLNLDHIVCFGDNRNDLPLFEASDKRYAVSNAVDELKAKADEIIGSNTEDGVASWLKNVRD